MVPLSVPARDLLKALLPSDANEAQRVVSERRASGVLVLPGAVGTPFAGWSKAKRALDKAIVDAVPKPPRARHWSFPGACTICAAPWPQVCSALASGSRSRRLF